MTSVTEQTLPAVTPTKPHFGLTKFLDPLRIPPVIRPHARWHQDDITVTMARARMRLHSQLPPSDVWTYQGQFPGPTIEVRRGKTLRVSWTNAIEGTIPLVAVQGPNNDPNGRPTDVPGGYRNPDGTLRPGFGIIEGVSDLPSWNVVHLHGARTGGGNDGWAHNAVLQGHAQLAEYPNEQPATTLWYHDHAMAVTRFNVHAGLAGMYLIRDDEEDELDLPDGDHEIPLILADRNLDTDPVTGALTGQLLFKVPFVNPPNQPDVQVQLPFTGPFNLVNGVIWPHLDVDRRWYRFRVLNAANARFYRLNLVDEAGAVVNDAVRIIGTDGGLLPAPAELPAAGLTLAPSERADLLVDFSRFGGQRLRLTDTSVAPGTTEPDLIELRVDRRDRHDRFELPDRLSRSYVRLKHGSTLPDHDHAWVALVPPGSLGDAHPQMWELQEITGAAPIPDTGVIQVVDPDTGNERTFRMVARLFDETTTIFIDHGRYAVWNFIHLGGPAHPMHIHLAELQLLGRRTVPLNAFDTVKGRTTTALQPSNQQPIEKYEEGWKDTFQVRPGEWISVAGEFAGATGEFMYHCHILDHEDAGMMHPFVVHPPEVARFHVHPGNGHHDHA